MRTFIFRMNAIFGNLETIKNYHKAVVLPMVEKAVVESKVMM